MSKKDFYIELESLKDKFEKMNPELEVTVRNPELGVEGYVVVWNTDISVGGKLERCGKGGTRITPDLSIDEIKMLARRMALKNAAAGLPLGGAKSGMRADPDAPEFEKQYKEFVTLCKPVLFENGGIFGGFGFDIGARPIHPHWACEALESTRSFTGKPIDMGGTDYDKEGIAGLGVAVAAKTALEEDNKPVKGASFSVQGIGAMGAAVIRYFSEYGGVLHSVADPRLNGTWIFDESGAPKELINAIANGNIEETNKIIKTGNYQHIEGSEDILYQNVDVLFPCAIQDVLSMNNVDKVKAKYVSEGANNPCCDKGHTRLFERGVTVIPDFIANPGGIIAAYVELTSKVTIKENIETRAKVNEAKDMTIERITDNVKKVMSLARKLNIEPVHAGMSIALKNVLGLNTANR